MKMLLRGITQEGQKMGIRCGRIWNRLSSFPLQAQTEPAHHVCRAKGKKERNEYDTEDYRKWIDWAKQHGLGIDFNVSYFTHPMMKDGCSLASDDETVRQYWIRPGLTAGKLPMISAGSWARYVSTTPGYLTAPRIYLLIAVLIAGA